MDIIKLISGFENVIVSCGATDEEILKAEKRLNLVFAEEYKSYLQKFSYTIIDSHEITGICSGKRLDVVKVTEEERSFNSFVPSNLYVIEQTHIDSIVVWQNEKGEIFQSYPNGNITKIFDSLSDYLINS